MEIPEEIAARYTESGQRERFEAAVGKILSVSAVRAEQIRSQSSFDRNP